MVCKQNGFEFSHGIVKGNLMGIIYNDQNKPLHSGIIDLIDLNSLNSKLNWVKVLAGDPDGNDVLVYKNLNPGELNPFKLSVTPNPFSNSVTISYTLPEDGTIDLIIYNLNGQVVNSLISTAKQKGDYQLSWDGTSGNGENISNGIYLCKLTFKNGLGMKQSDELKIVLSR